MRSSTPYAVQSSVGNIGILLDAPNPGSQSEDTHGTRSVTENWIRTSPGWGGGRVPEGVGRAECHHLCPVAARIMARWTSEEMSPCPWDLGSHSSRPLTASHGLSGPRSLRGGFSSVCLLLGEYTPECSLGGFSGPDSANGTNRNLRRGQQFPLWAADTPVAPRCGLAPS